MCYSFSCDCLNWSGSLREWFGELALRCDGGVKEPIINESGREYQIEHYEDEDSVFSTSRTFIPTPDFITLS